ncbi:MAG: OmpA family protein [Methylacidiphilales bacterium]|nr:OmpA family protein [Candidatus Methylacidiphilales bacterium]
MPIIGVHTEPERLQKRWVLGALGLALLIHLLVAWALGWYRIPALEIPSSHGPQTGPFNVKRIEINPDSLKPQQDNPIDHLPAAEPPKNPADFNLDPNQVEKMLQTPQPSLATPSVPEPNRVIAATDLNHSLPFAESNDAKITTEVAHTEPASTGSPTSSAKLVQDILSSNSSYPQPGLPGGAPAGGNGVNGTLPGFAQLAPAFNANSSLSNLPEPILLRLPSDVLFDFDSTSLKPEAAPLLTQAIGLITKYPQADIQIDGYSDSFGKPDYNQTLSQQRSVAVQEWLRQHIGGDGYKFHSRGHGSADYIVSPQGSIEQQQPNRRVEILIQALKP